MLTALPIQDFGLNLNKRSSDAVKLRYDWPVDDIPSNCVCRVDHSMICKLGGFVTQRHNELRDLEAELLSNVCNDVGTKPVLQDILGGTLKCEIGHPYTWVLGALTIGVLSYQSLSPKCRIV